ncbi:glutaredoxin domain-containing protein [Ampullimonas aquatilis]|uniref:glutaredoxin domain-containing protein n=1 Tax=Ampullimonas aquatilis TaxID=1341549 RepID=UPI003C78F280
MLKFVIAIMILIGAYMHHEQDIAAVRQTSNSAEAQTIAQADLVLYTTTDCGYCKAAKEWLTTHHIAYVECNTDTSALCEQNYQHLPSEGIPTFVYKGAVKTGLDYQWMEQTLGQTSVATAH